MAAGNEEILGLSEAFKALRSAVFKNNVTLASLSQETGLSKCTISRFAKGSTDLTMANFMRIANVVGARVIVLAEEDVAEIRLLG